MNETIKQSFVMSCASFVIGIILLLMSMFGERNAIQFSRPRNNSTWTTSQELIQAFIYVPMVLGVFFFILSLIIFSITYHHWFKHRVK